VVRSVKSVNVFRQGSGHFLGVRRQELGVRKNNMEMEIAFYG
jgi:hypothetical protein